MLMDPIEKSVGTKQVCAAMADRWIETENSWVLTDMGMAE